ncbi:hypothetical protein NQ176_g8809 [Zarea fungicola]|uniref:Uncharacterized protein n=1 Tax=Zarea fungicola TaxID=93591 RepID=A0ACC1MSE2_9HYPO|nr:hypothetical protein NQ176_g8809 [Lecanicillium fungicola]
MEEEKEEERKKWKKKRKKNKRKKENKATSEAVFADYSLQAAANSTDKAAEETYCGRGCRGVDNWPVSRHRTCARWTSCLDGQVLGSLVHGELGAGDGPGAGESGMPLRRVIVVETDSVMISWPRCDIDKQKYK